MDFILVVVIVCVVCLGLFFILDFIFFPIRSEEFLLDGCNFIKDVLGLLAFSLMWGIFLMIPFMSGLLFLDLILLNNLSEGIGFLNRMLLSFVCLVTLIIWYILYFQSGRKKYKYR